MSFYGKEEIEENKNFSGKDITKLDLTGLRDQDNLLRIQLADKIKNIIRDIEQCRKNLTKKMELGNLKEIGSIINRIIALEGKIRHAEQGYTGISADYKIQYEALKLLYKWDLKLINNIDDLKKSVNLLLSAINSSNIDNIQKEMSNISYKLGDFTELFEKRREVVPGLEVK